MYSRSFNELHYARHKHVASVAYGVYLDFLAQYVFIYEYRLVLVYLYSSLEILPQLIFVADYLHGPSAQNERRPYKYRIAYIISSLHAVFDLGDRVPRRLRDPQLIEDLLKSVSVLGPVDGFAVRTYQLYASFHERLCKIYRRLAAECRYDALRLLEVDDGHYILSCKRLEVQLVSSRVICRYCLRVVVDDDGFVSCAPYGLHCMHGGIVEFNTLADPYRAGAKHYYLLLIGESGFVLSCI